MNTTETNEKRPEGWRMDDPPEAFDEPQPLYTGDLDAETFEYRLNHGLLQK